MPRINAKNNFFWLTIALVGLLITGAFSRAVSENVTLQLLEFSSIALLMLSLLSLRTNRAWLKNFVIIIALLLVSTTVRLLTKFEIFEYAYLAFLLAFLLGAAWLVADEVLLTGTVDLNKVVGAVALYLILGLIWSIFYTIILEFAPEAFRGIEAGPWYDNMPTTTYFSFVTLTTLGYGDISPANPIAEVFVVLEAVVGMFYLAVIVASLVGALRETD